MEDKKMLNEEELENIAGGESKEEQWKREVAMRGTLSVDPVTGNYTFTDKNGNTGVFTAQQWNTLAQEWAYTGDPQWWMRTLDVSELQAKL